MGRLDLGRHALGVCALAVLAACGGGSGTPLSPTSYGLPAERTHPHPAFSVLHGFEGPPSDGAYPFAGLVNINGTLYGTTSGGGDDCTSSSGCGTLFTITPSGTETVLYNFGKGNDGAEPTDDPIAVGGKLYGTTSAGGSHDGGTVFAMTPSGSEVVLHSFNHSPDGFNPFAGLIDVKGKLYGTTRYGGKGDGTVFSITTSGKETVLYAFAYDPDGAVPYGLLNVGGTLYGTTYSGGRGECHLSFGCGTVYSITTSGKERVLHRFGTGADGENPFSGLINVNGTLYGTTEFGGANGDGTVFAITTSGKETILYSFKGGRDGANPDGDLLNVNGTLYGVTLAGGTRCPKHGGCGTVFAITTSGAETVLHSIGGSGGANPEGTLLNVNGTLYGSTLSGGVNNEGAVFSLSP